VLGDPAGCGGMSADPHIPRRLTTTERQSTYASHVNPAFSRKSAAIAARPASGITTPRRGARPATDGEHVPGLALGRSATSPVKDVKRSVSAPFCPMEEVILLPGGKQILTPSYSNMTAEGSKASCHQAI
jgi:hypothetical protein